MHYSAHMKRIKLSDLRHAGSSHHFIGADHDVAISSFLFNGLKGSGPGPHRHPYDEIQFIQSGRARYTVEGQEFEAGAGEILVIKAGEVHGFTVVSDEPLVQVDVHMSSRFVQENLPRAAS